MNSQAKIAVTMGDPNGIGPEITIKSINNLLKQKRIDLNKLLLIGNKKIFESTAKTLNIDLPDIDFIEIECDLSKIEFGFENKESGRISYKCLEKACDLGQQKKISAIVTAPLSKNAINIAGYKFSGQTEVLEKKLAAKDKQAQMLFVAGAFKVLLLTRHIAIKDIPKNLNKKHIIECVKTLNQSLIRDFKIKKPKIAICGLNPHAGEGGLLGKEEQEIIIPAIKELQKDGIQIEGAFPADTLFVKAANSCLNDKAQPYDCYVACYHDQGLTPIKVCAMDKTVNTTIGLPVLRTSPAHGTAFDIAGKGIADSSSMEHAILLAYNSVG